MDRNANPKEKGTDATGPASPDDPGHSSGARSRHGAQLLAPPEPGSYVRLLTLGDDEDGGTPARVLEVDGERLVLRLPRGADSLGQSLRSGIQVQLLLGRRDSAHLFQASVLSRPDEGTVAVMLSGHPLRLQRREYFRITVRLPIAVGLPREVEAEEPAGDNAATAAGGSGAAGAADPSAQIPEVRIFRLADLSGGGCLCLDPDNLLRRGRLYPASLDLHDGESALQVRVEVVRRGVSFGYPSAGLRFVALAEKYRERIMRTLFREYRSRATGERPSS